MAIAHVRVKATIPVGSKPIGVAANPRTNRIYVADGGDETWVISGGTLWSPRSAWAASPSGVTANLRTNTIYVTNIGGNTVSVLVS